MTSVLHARRPLGDDLLVLIGRVREVVLCDTRMG